MDFEMKESRDKKHNIFVKGLEVIKNVSNIMLTIMLIALILLLGASIAMMNIVGQPIGWSNAVGRYLYIYIVFIGSAIAYMEEGHASLEFAHNKMKSKMKVVFDALNYLIMMGFSLLIIYQGTKYAIKMWGVSSPVLMFLSMGIVYLSVPISFTIIFLFSIRQTIEIKNKYRN